ncbi:hypothetical protein ILUMI_18404 [Ignelater luminosus]|uniref:Uncharacterized protein n=1 Tax=Ignelater luminosus TaxID=2038154 RepID=A0A8K0CQ85_IGNLU|nr:hypothetical protein ILUMI_18404 [Ignelater luminosus]
MNLKSGTIIWCCLIIGILLLILQVECKRRSKHKSADSSRKVPKYQYEVHNLVNDFPHGLNQDVILDSDYITDCHLFVENLCSGATPICMSNGTIICVASPSSSTPCPAADCVIVKDKQCNAKWCEHTFPCLIRIRKLVTDSTNKRTIDPLPPEKGLCVTLVANPVHIS